MPYQSVFGLEYLDKVVQVDQSPIGRTPRSNPVTYSGVFSDIRDCLPYYRVENQGLQTRQVFIQCKRRALRRVPRWGMKLIEMNFLPDVYVHCDKCNRKRYNRETLEVRYRGKSISDVADMTINQAVDFFESYRKFSIN